MKVREMIGLDEAAVKAEVEAERQNLTAHTTFRKMQITRKDVKI